MTSGTGISAETAARLKHVKFKSRALDLRHFPDFMIVGPQRTGTTWLAQNLSYHPQIFVSVPKEIHFFNLLTEPDHRKYRSSHLEWYLSFFRDTPLSYLRKMSRSLLKYREPYSPRTRGEATASYAALAPEVIAEIIALRPDIRIILMIRNPLDRAWSHAKKDLAKRMRRPIAEVPVHELERFFSDDYQQACGHYSRTIRNWSEMLPEGNLFLGRFDDIHTDPATLLTDIYRFLGVNADPRYTPQQARDRINPTEPQPLPEQHRRLLNEMFADDLDFLRTEHGMVWD